MKVKERWFFSKRYVVWQIMSPTTFSLTKKNKEWWWNNLHSAFRAFRGPKVFDVLLGYKTGIAKMLTCLPPASSFDEQIISLFCVGILCLAFVWCLVTDFFDFEASIISQMTSSTILQTSFDGFDTPSQQTMIKPITMTSND